MSKNVYQKYKQTSVTSASREKLLLMLYEAAIKFTKQAIVACETKNIGDRGLYIGKTYDIVMELSNTLNFEVGGEIAKNLEQLYMYIMEQLTQSNVKGEATPLHNVLKILNTLNDGWVQAVDSIKKQKNSPTEET